MTNTDVVGQIVTTASTFFTFMFPIIGVLAGITFVTSLMFSVLGFGRKSIGGI